MYRVFFHEGEGTQQRGLRLTVLLTSVVLLGYRLQKGGNMCYNCGCGIPNDNLGDPRNITDKTFEDAAKAVTQSPEEAKRNTLALLKKILKEEETQF